MDENHRGYKFDENCSHYVYNFRCHYLQTKWTVLVSDYFESRELWINKLPRAPQMAKIWNYSPSVNL